MNEALIKNIIKYKLTKADKILNQLPQEMSDNLRNLSKIVLKSINESSQEIKDEPVNKSKEKDGLKNIGIE
ncbi:hypothetical protein JK636_01790 [Clostridium sp. YIM B02515]|uniref:Uncharacterized protein n=1 Tax=Clostridium rhizosphaerae TaxID=2803861 RepID=A0ABS1T567_9CLOT|nr:hypothetical protein [Clostridium rhizosphaerae]MBL4934486.1 hypothetical protein [Clostridium rhizosphaerae]